MSEQVGQNERRRALLGHLLRREVVVFVGAGASAAANLPDWKTLVAQLGEKLPDLAGADLTRLDSLDVPQWYVDEHGREHLEDLLVSALGNPTLEPSDLHRALADLPVSLFFTTNYDELLERALEARGEHPDTIVDNRHVALLNDLTATTVVKMHGCVTLPDTIVLAREDYERYAERHTAIITYLQALLATRTFLFVGFSFADPNFRAIHDAIGRALGQYQRRAYALMKAPQNPLFANHWAKRGVEFITLPDPATILRFVRDLAAESGRQLERGTSLPHLLTTLGKREPPPVFAAAVRIEERLDAVRDELRTLVADASRDLNLRLVSRLPDDAGGGQGGREATLEKVRALYGLSQGLGQLGYPIDADDWLRLGNALYQHRDWELAIRAYTAAQRRTDGRQRWAEGNLARAYLRLHQYARAEAILRRLALVTDRDSGNARGRAATRVPGCSTTSARPTGLPTRSTPGAVNASWPSGCDGRQWHSSSNRRRRIRCSSTRVATCSTCTNKICSIAAPPSAIFA
jgi:tetratricopeptide (TPR) repeat protein